MLAILWKVINKLVRTLLRSYHVATQLNPYSDFICSGFEVGFVPAEVLQEISLQCHQGKKHGK
jgi:hypothetical protein